MTTATPDYIGDLLADMEAHQQARAVKRTRQQELEALGTCRLHEGLDEAIVWNPDGFVTNMLRVHFEIHRDAFGAQSIHVKRVWLVPDCAVKPDLDITEVLSRNDIERIADDIYERMEWDR